MIKDKWKCFWEYDLKSEQPPDELLKRSYRFIRISLVAMALAILVSMFVEVWHAGWNWEHSISAYYYTAARPMFTGALIAIGVLLISIKGRTDVEDISLNLAGMMAPLVPLIPPGQASPSKGSMISPVGYPISEIQRHTLLVNSLTTVVIVAVMAFAFLLITGRRKRGKWVKFETRDKVGLVVAGFVAAMGVTLYVIWPFFQRNAHFIAAIMMFVFLYPAIIANVKHSPRGGDNDRFAYYKAYKLIAWSMALVAIGIVGSWFLGEWDHRVLFLELLELTPFLFFWGFQTVEHWNVGVVTNENVQAA